MMGSETNAMFSLITLSSGIYDLVKRITRQLGEAAYC